MWACRPRRTHRGGGPIHFLELSDWLLGVAALGVGAVSPWMLASWESHLYFQAFLRQVVGPDHLQACLHFLCDLGRRQRWRYRCRFVSGWLHIAIVGTAHLHRGVTLAWEDEIHTLVVLGEFSQGNARCKLVGPLNDFVFVEIAQGRNLDSLAFWCDQV